jgi:RNA polymerase sigma-70 factor (family 1)
VQDSGKDIQDYVAAFQRGEEQGFTYFFNALYPALMYYAYRILNDKAAAEDVVEESFIKIWERHTTFSHHQVIKSWLYTTVRNACINIKQQEQRQNTHKETIARSLQVTQESPLNDMIVAEVITQVHATIQVLPTECRRIFQMLYIQGKTVREIAEELGLSISTIKNQKARGLEILRKRFPELTTVAVLEAINLL